MSFIKMDAPREHKHESKECPRCKARFICKLGDVSNCQCSGIKMSADEQNHVAEKYGDCLCCSCLKEEQHSYALDKFNARIKFVLRMDRYPVK